ncbi:MAG: leucyl/phenylalanyl-tRNA--protein transferase [Bacteroidetes bacterium]|nr:MAG: leucyl/phenylalanyl-tRNA--protein transferase [Bacteroidota bacterium]
MVIDLTPERLLHAYANGLFPMADPDEEDAVYWFAPDPRGILPLDAFHVPRSVARLVRQERFEVTADEAFGAVIRACADREETWLSAELIAAYERLHDLGHAHSIECWHGGELAGGLYGVALGGAFFGESMFHRVRDASKVALVHLVQRLRRGGFVLLDTQYRTEHLARFGGIEIPREDYLRRLWQALRVAASW